MGDLPKSPIMLLSFLNTQLRDRFPSLDDLCTYYCADRSSIEETLGQIDYHYDSSLNRFC